MESGAVIVRLNSLLVRLVSGNPSLVSFIAASTVPLNRMLEVDRFKSQVVNAALPATAKVKLIGIDAAVLPSLSVTKAVTE